MIDRVRIRNFVVDVVLVGAAVSYASGLAQAWLVDHEIALAYVTGGLHITMLPLMLVASTFKSRAFGGRAPRQVLLWSMIAYYALGFIVPIALDEHAGVGDTFRAVTLLGQIVVGAGTLLLLVFGNLVPARIIARAQSRLVRLPVAFVAGAYLLCLEAALITMGHGARPYAGPFGLVAAAVAGYLPVRVYLAVALEGGKWDLIAMAIAFVHFLWRIAS